MTITDNSRSSPPMPNSSSDPPKATESTTDDCHGKAASPDITGSLGNAEHLSSAVAISDNERNDEISGNIPPAVEATAETTPETKEYASPGIKVDRHDNYPEAEAIVSLGSSAIEDTAAKAQDCRSNGSVITSPPEPRIPPAVVEKCFIPYSIDSPPSLYGVAVGPATDQDSNPSICLAPGLLFNAVATVSAAFASHSSSLLVDSTDKDKNTLPVTVICSPHLNSLVAVDAAVRHIAHRVEADVVILDPADLAAGRHGVFGEELTDAFWQLYNYHYLESDRAQKCSWDTSDSNSSDGLHSESDEQFGLEMLFDNPDGSSASGKPQAAKIEESSFTRAKALVQKYLLTGMRSNANTETGNSTNRRRILYLRDYGALSKAMSPLLPVLRDAASYGSPTLIVAGVSPIQRVASPRDTSRRSSSGWSWKHTGTQHERFLDRLEGGDSSFMEYLYERLCATWRKPPPGSVGRYESLEDIFTATFINRYQGKGLCSRSRNESSFHLCGQKYMKLQFMRIIRIGLLHDPPSVIQDVSQNERRKRFLLANLQVIYHNAAQQGKFFHFNVDHCCEPYSQSSNSKILIARLESSVLANEQLKYVASSLHSSAGFEDVLLILTEIEKYPFDTEWRRILQMVRSGRPSEVGEQPTVDPIVKRVRADSSLNSHEQKLLNCIVEPTTIQTTFTDVCVNPEIIDTLRMAVSYPIMFPEAYKTGILAQQSMGGVLLFGPPGTGKTMACRALAKECGARMLQLHASTIQDYYVGETEKLISAAFSLARRLGPCVIFVDELDALFSKRNDTSQPWHRTMVTELTQQMEGLNTGDANQQTGLVVVGATNRPQDIDSAVARRFSRRILVDLPTFEQREAIINQHLKSELYDETVSIPKLAACTSLFSGSDLRHLVYAAALAALKEIIPTSGQIQYGADGVPIPESSHTSLESRVIRGHHFDQARKQVSASNAMNPSRRELDELRRWAKESVQASL